MIINDFSIMIVQNDYDNNFTVKSTLLIDNLPQILKWKYYKYSK
jgi:hypothetical protein